MIIVNITFVVDVDRSEKVCAWLREKIVIELASQGMNPRACRILNPEPDAASSVALQVELPDMSSAESWMGDKMINVLEEYEAEFGPQALFFHSLLETI